MKNKLILYSFLLLLSLGSCVKEEIINNGDHDFNSGEQEGKGSVDENAPKRTVFVYMIASNLGDDLQRNLGTMASVATKKNLNGGNLVVYYSVNSSKAFLFEIKEGDDGVIVRDTLEQYDGQSAVDAGNMRSVIDEVVRLYPSDSYGMILSSHGTAWMPTGYKHMLRSFGEESGKWMEIDELANAIPDHTFDFILLDACSMGAVECMYELKDKADYIVASPSEVLTVGFPYKTILPYLFKEEPDYENIAKDFHTFFTNYSYPYGDIAVTVTKELDGLAAATREILQGEEGVLSLDLSTLQTLSYLPDSPVRLVDFGDMVKHLATAGQYRAFETALQKAVLYPYSTHYIYCSMGGRYQVSTYSGLSVYPMRAEYTQINDWYRSRLSWYQAVYK